MDNWKEATEMTEQEAQMYCEQVLKEYPWLKETIEIELNAGSTYRQIAFQLQTT